MSAENLRIGLLGAIRYGKCMIIDFDNMDMFDALQTFVNNVKSDLFEAILSKKGKRSYDDSYFLGHLDVRGTLVYIFVSVIEEEYYKTLVKPGDHKDYQVSGFNRSRVPHFKFVILMKTAPDEEWLDNTYPIQIVPSQSAA